MPLIVTNSVDVGADISREIEYQRHRGHVPLFIEMSPEVHESLRLQAKAPRGALLREHDDLPVRVNRRLIGLKQWRVICRGGVQVQEKVRDAVRLAGRLRV